MDHCLDSPPQQWEQFKTLVTEFAKLTVGPKKKVHQNWFDENDKRIKELLDDKKKAFIKWQNDISTSKHDRFKNLQRQAQAALRRMQDEWWENKADEIETYAATKNSRMFFNAIKEVYGPTKPRTTTLLAANGSTLLKAKSSINARWREHFSALFNRPFTVFPTVIDQIPQKPMITSLDLPPKIDEVSKAIRQTSSGKSPGMDGIPAEIFKSAGPVALEVLHSLLTSIWEEEDVPKEFRNATFVSLFKKRAVRPTTATTGASLSCPSVVGKILDRVILNRLITNISEENLPEAQCGFRPNHSTTYMIFSVRQVQEKCFEQNMDLFTVFIDPTKAFDTVKREALWVIMSKPGCPTKFVNLIRQFHDDMTEQVLSEGEASEPFSISNCVKQGCV